MNEAAHTQRHRPAAWAIAASFGLHALGFSAVSLNEWHANAQVDAAQQGAQTQPVLLLEPSPHALLRAASSAAHGGESIQADGLAWVVQSQPTAPKIAPKPAPKKTVETAAKIAANPSAAPPIKPVQPVQPVQPAQPVEPAPAAALIAPQALLQNTAQSITQNTVEVQKTLALATPPSPPATAPVAATLPMLSPPKPTPLDYAAPAANVQDSLPAVDKSTPSPQSSAAPLPSTAATEPAAAPSYRLPSQLTVQFETTVRGFAGKSVLSWKKTAQGAGYEAQLVSTVAILFKTLEHRFESNGAINEYGLAPLRLIEKRPNGGTVATTIEPAQNRVVISSKEGFLPYEPRAHDVLSLMVQLAVYAQTQPRWQMAGTAQDFTVYRPSGIKRWRFQSMGLVVLEQGAVRVQTVHVRRVPLGAEADYEDQYHFWLDINRYGFPVKIRQVDSKANVTDINMVSWQASD